MGVRIQHRRDTAVNWTTGNPTPVAGEFCWESDTNQVKMGDGVTAWTTLPYLHDNAGALTALQADVADILTILGRADGDTDLGSFTGSTAPDAGNLLGVIQALETAIEALPSNPLNPQGVWDATANNPALADGVGTVGDYYIVSVAGTTSLDGNADWGIGDTLFFGTGNTWNKVDNTGLSEALAAGSMLVGSAGGVATAVSMSGDATMDNAGAVTLADTAVTAGSYGGTDNLMSATVDSKGRVTAMADVTTLNGGTAAG